MKVVRTILVHIFFSTVSIQHEKLRIYAYEKIRERNLNKALNEKRYSVFD